MTDLFWIAAGCIGAAFLIWLRNKLDRP
ncbi:hypothetical protein CcrKarma_gp122 [Caulobacter virus Karma]|nr:hypothetical protein CcrKarma_gp122 [Caulobacter virus Karma]AFU87639.1 hypothetical protein CcrKarma_gp122 [Caulobacter virus Karma]